MTDVSSELERLAEADGATFQCSVTGAWYAKNRDGAYVVRGALSKAEAARLYCEDKDLVASTPDAILEYIRSQYRPYDTLPAFDEGFRAYRLDGAHRRNPYDGQTGPQAGVNGQAWDRGANAAMLYQRATSYRDNHPIEVEAAGPGWLARFIRSGGRR